MSDVQAKRIDSEVLKQAIRDVASKRPEISNPAICYFYSIDFKRLCARRGINELMIRESMERLFFQSFLSRQSVAKKMAAIIDRELIDHD